MGLDLKLSLAMQPAEKSTLSSCELDRLTGLKLEQRKQSWLVGRNALKSLCNSMNLSTDTSLLSMPHPHISLTHSGKIAVAIGCRNEASGIGIDLELVERPGQEAARLFLTMSEMQQLESVPEHEKPWLMQKLWCIKEAAFKANPDNHSSHVFDYEIENIFSHNGDVVWISDEEVHGRYMCMPIISEMGQGCVAFVYYPKGEKYVK